MKSLGIKRRAIRVCIESDCKQSVFSKARCRKHYRNKFITKVYKRTYDSDYQRNYYITHRDLYFTYKQTPEYKAYMKQYNEIYGQLHGRLKRPAIYWRNRWAKIKESDGCTVCHSQIKLEAHHIKPVKQCKKLNWSDEQTHAKENLLILCEFHHRSKDINKKLHTGEDINEVTSVRNL